MLPPGSAIGRTPWFAGRFDDAAIPPGTLEQAAGVVVEQRSAAAARTSRIAVLLYQAAIRDVAKTAAYTRAYADRVGFLTLLSGGERLTGAYALGLEAGGWLQQATLAIRARVPLGTIQPFPTFSEIYVAALNELHKQPRVATTPGPPETTGS